MLFEGIIGIGGEFYGIFREKWFPEFLLLKSVLFLVWVGNTVGNEKILRSIRIPGSVS
jgi:hypothetical protein